MLLLCKLPLLVLLYLLSNYKKFFTISKNCILRKKYVNAFTYTIINSSNFWQKLLESEFISNFNDAKEDFELNTCIRLVPRTTQERYIRYYYGTYCSSPIGAGTNVIKVNAVFKVLIMEKAVFAIL